MRYYSIYAQNHLSQKTLNEEVQVFLQGLIQGYRAVRAQIDSMEERISNFKHPLPQRNVFEMPRQYSQAVDSAQIVDGTSTFRGIEPDQQSQQSRMQVKEELVSECLEQCKAFIQNEVQKIAQNLSSERHFIGSQHHYQDENRHPNIKPQTIINSYLREYESAKVNGHSRKLVPNFPEYFERTLETKIDQFLSQRDHNSSLGFDETQRIDTARIIQKSNAPHQPDEDCSFVQDEMEELDDKLLFAQAKSETRRLDEEVRRKQRRLQEINQILSARQQSDDQTSSSSSSMISNCSSLLKEEPKQYFKRF